MARKRKESNSRPARWARAVDDLGASLDALNDLEELRAEYEEWRDGLPENLQNSALGEKLNAVADLDIQSVIDSLDSLIGEVDGMDLPLGFGRD